MNLKYKIETYGCQMNVHDSEKLAGILSSLNCTPAKSIDDADIIVFNTCCIRDTAEAKIYGNIGALKSLKANNKELIIAVVGCMTQQDGAADNLKAKFPFVDIVLGTANASLLGEKIKELLTYEGKKRLKIYETAPLDKQVDENVPVFRSSGINAWINIMYGCDNFCTYCIVPYVRGRERSREPSLIISEAESLLKEGYKEITLLGQNVNSYGNDRNDGYTFPKLLDTIARLPYKFRLRFMTSHPKDFTEELVSVIASNPNIPNGIHLPVQAGSNAVLKAMNRKYTREQYLSLIDLIKSKLNNPGITTDIMVGFPGETEDDFLFTLDLVEKVRYSNAFTFIYSSRKGTVAAKAEQLSYSVKKDRITRLIALQNKITKEDSAAHIGNVYEVLVESEGKTQGSVCGRTEGGRLVNIMGGKELIGQFVNVKINKAKSSSLWGVLI
ncbi:MAG: tRNA (N6-isopentenyl adenosine(37)-C2)-methylthiotransferase MiaB [Clostridia bacterium]